MRVAAATRGRLVRVLAATAMLASSLAVSAPAGLSNPAPAAATQPTAAQPAATQPTAKAEVTTSISTPTNGIVQPGTDLLLEATISNPTTATLGAGTISIVITSSALHGTDELNSWLQPPAASAEIETRTLAEIPTQALPAGQNVTIPAMVPASGLGFSAGDPWQVRGLADRLSVGGAVVAQARSSLVFSPGGVLPKTNVSIAMPLTAPTGSRGILSASDLATFTAQGGILARQLAGVEAAPNVAVGIDPMIIASIRALGSAAPASTTAWLAELSRLPNETFPLAYADADPAVQAQSGQATLLAPTSLAFALDPANFHGPLNGVGETDAATPGPTSPTPVPGSPPASPSRGPGPGSTQPTPTPTATPTPNPLPTLDQLLAWPYTLSGVAWPADATVRAADFPVFAASGVNTTVLSSGNVSDSASASDGPRSIIAPVTGGHAVVADAGASAALRAAVTATSDQAWRAAVAEVAARLALVAQQSGSSQTAPSVSNLLLTLDRRWPSTEARLSQTLAAVNTMAWVAPADFSQALASPASSTIKVKDSPEGAARIQSVRSLTDREREVAAFATVTADPTVMIGEQRASLLTLLGTGWLDPAYDWSASVTNSLNASLKTITSIQIVTRTDVNVVGTSASIPITISNELDEPVTVILHARPSNGRLEIGNDVTKVLQANSRAAALVPVNARLGNGKVILHLELMSPTGVPIGAQPSVPVNVRADWEGLAALLIGILIVLFFGFGIVRSVLRRRKSRDASAQPVEEGPDQKRPADKQPETTTTDEEPRG
ncbi:MAG: DUF6049 family protein [Microbacteriaceae bacterium]